MKKILLISLTMFLIISVVIIIYTIEISGNFTEFDGEDDEIEDESVESTYEIIENVRYEEYIDNTKQKFSINNLCYYSRIHKRDLKK